MRCDASPVPANDGDFSQGTCEQICAATKSCCYYGTTLYTTNGIYDFSRPYMIGAHTLFRVISKLNYILIRGSVFAEHQVGKFGLLYQFHSGNKKLQVIGGILSYCADTDEY